MFVHRFQLLHCLLPVCLLILGSAHGQETVADDGEASAPETADRSRILYIDVPVPIEPGVDPDMPEPQLGIAMQEGVEFEQRAASIRDYNAAVAEIELNGGAWDPTLVEELTALGTLLQQQGDHAEAIETLQRATHVNRINAGLHTLEQVPMVETMIDSYMALGDWGNVDLYQNYLYYVQQRAYGGSDPRLIPVLHDLGQWNIEAFNIGFGEPLGIRLSTAQMLFDTAARMVGMHFGRDDERYVSYLRSVANSAYLVALHPDYVREVQGPEYFATQEAFRQQLNVAGRQPRGYSAGEEALQAIVDFYREEPGNDYGLAEALTNLADWNLMFERYREAESLYGEAWNILAETAASAELIAQLFGQVIPIPTFSKLPTNLLIGAQDSQERQSLHDDYADVRLNVTQSGAPRQVEVISEETEANDRQLSRLRREIRGMVFRPLIVDGEPVDSEGHLFRYRYWY